MLKKIFLGLLLLNLSVLYPSKDKLGYVNNQQIVRVENYPSYITHKVSGEVLHVERKATNEEMLLAAKKAQMELDYLNRPYRPLLQCLFEPIYANLEYLACAKPFGVSNIQVLGLGLIGYLGYSIYKDYQDKQKEAVISE